MRYLLPLVLLLAGCNREKPLPVLGEVPHFELTDQHGQPFQGSTLQGHVWVADFIFTTCPGPCPRMTSTMHAVQKATAAAVRLVSFTIDPQHDTPEALAAYSRKFAADDTRWSFLTGAVATLNMLAFDAFHLGTVDAALEHSTRFVLVDGKGRIRAYYGFADADVVNRVAHDAERLRKEPA